MGFCLAVASLCPAVANEVNWPVACKPVGFVILYRLRRIRAVRLTVRDECVVLGLQTSPKFRTIKSSFETIFLRKNKLIYLKNKKYVFSN